MPGVANFQWNQRARSEDHQKFGPALLHVNADAFGEENCAVKERECAGRAERAAGECGLQFVEQENDVFAVGEQKLIVRPIRNLIEPKRPAVQKQK